jgi:hypothetical protein
METFIVVKMMIAKKTEISIHFYVKDTKSKSIIFCVHGNIFLLSFNDKLLFCVKNLLLSLYNLSLFSSLSLYPGVNVHLKMIKIVKDWSNNNENNDFVLYFATEIDRKV